MPRDPNSPRYPGRLYERGLPVLLSVALVLLWVAPGAHAANRIYWGDTGGGVSAISFANLNGTGHGGDLNTTGVTPNGPTGLAMDLLRGKIYWADSNANTISFANLDNTGGGGHLTTTGATAPGSPNGVATDPDGGRIYWADGAMGGPLSFAKLDNTGGGGDLSTSGATVADPDGIAINPVNGKIYWANASGNKISFANLDGSGGGDLNTTGATVNSPRGVAIGPANGKIYWANAGDDTHPISFAKLNDTGGGGDLNVSGASPHVASGVAIEPGRGKIYWANKGSNTISFASLNDTGGGGEISTAGASTPNNPEFPALLKTPVATGKPTINGGSVAGSHLSCSTGQWAPDLLQSFLYRRPVSFSYRWSLNGAPISGATTNSITASSAGNYTCTVTATNQAGRINNTSAPQSVTSGGGSGSGLHVSARNRVCPGSGASTCAVLLDAQNHIVHMHGVNYSGTEYACIQGWGIWSQPDPTTSASIQAMLAWHVNFVRINLNEDCWLGLNVSGHYTINSAYYGANYRNAIINWVNQLHAAGIYTEIVDMWNAPGTAEATYQDNQPDADNSPAMWASMAQTFKNDPDTILSPSGETTTSFPCLMDGGCVANFSPGTANPGPYDGLPSCGSNCYEYNVAGLAQGVSIMRQNGFDGPIALECRDFGNSCDEGGGNSWLATKPTDSLNPSQLMAEVHVYGGNGCSTGPPITGSSQVPTTASCFDAEYLPIIRAGYPLFFGETGENYTNGDCTNTNIPGFISWADAYGVGYMPWAWDNWSSCGALFGSTVGQAYASHTFTATTASGSTTLSSVSSFSGLTANDTISGLGIPAGATITSLNSSARTLTMSLPATATATAVTVDDTGWQGWIQAHYQSFANPAPMNLISQGKPAYGEGTVDWQASNGVSSDYGSEYRCTPPCALDVDLSTVSASQRQQVAVAWYNDEEQFYPPLNSSYYYNSPQNYTIDANTAPGGGSPPTSGWTTLATVTGNPYHSRMHRVNLAGANWIRMRVTSSLGSSGNTDAAFHLDVLDASAGTTDSWLFLGDSFTDCCMTHQEPNNFMQQVNATNPSSYPIEMNGGVGGTGANDFIATDPSTGQRYITEMLNAFPGHYVGLDFRNDVGTISSDLRTALQAVIAAGKQPEMRYSPPWSCDSNYISSVPTVMAGYQSMVAQFPQLVIGPDLYTFFYNNQSLISSDCIHPTSPTGQNADRQQYVDALLANAYAH